MKTYSSFDEIKYELKRLNLERQISLEEIKSLKLELQEDLSPYHWIKTGYKAISKFGTILLLKKIFK
ncbi:hypothetical protein [Abyssalbus ytuae]|uniref:Uncharacterized protein n=1 Tax=Abyssalbus ytuae TaxID=2926907 RepID=A0A9E7CYJ4_9FLAO|nr:hypothetical protein [Abyssalbus ytuae]UOB16720.1 hypothetical protein MQE35_13355 [Abyssalbus ytuae]